MSALLKKIIVSLLVFVVLFTSVAPNFFLVKAQDQSNLSAPAEGSWYNQGFDQWYNKVYDENTSPGNEIFGERYTAAQVQWVIYSLFAFVINGSLSNSTVSQKAVACIFTNVTNIETCSGALKDLLEGGNSQGTSQQTGGLRELSVKIFADRPFSGIAYTKSKLNKFSLIPEAKAAGPGFGFDALSPVQDMWRASRNIAFGLFVIVAIVFAFMIMFRVKISPQVVISVQSAIPKLIIALVLVTFSYAIAGFLIDLMYVVIGILSIIFAQLFTIGKTTPGAVFDLLTGVRNGNQTGIGGLIGFSIFYLFTFVLALLILLSQAISSVLLGLISIFALGSGIGTVILILALFITVIIFIWNMIKTWWALLKAFTNILLLTIFAPIQITLGTFIPTLSFGQWIKNFCANLAVFVTTGALMLLSLIFLLQAWLRMGLNFIPGFVSKILLGPFSPFNTSGSDYWPPLLGSGKNTDTTIGLLFLGTSFVIFTLIPKAADIIQGFISGKPFAYGSAVGETTGRISGTTLLVSKGATSAGVSAIEEGAGRKIPLGNVLRTVGWIR